MVQPATQREQTARSQISDCWNRIGVRGDMSCPELETYIHCRNCPIFSAAAAKVLDGALPQEYLDHWTLHVAQPKVVAQADTESVVMFRVGSEWLALPTRVFKEIASVRTIHSLPQRRNESVLGLANIRGELAVCISLQQMLGIEKATTAKHERRVLEQQRLLVLAHEGSHAVCPVDEVYGVQRFQRRDFKEVPATVARAAATYTKAVLAWNKHTVGMLDEQLLFYTIDRSLASATKI